MDLALPRILSANVLCALFLALAAIAAAQGPHGGLSPRPEGGEWNWASEPGLDANSPEVRGFLFVDGQYVSPPHHMRVEDDTLLVNDLPVICKRPPEGVDRFRRSRPGQQARRLGNELSQQLGQPLVVVAVTDQPIVVIVDPTVQCELLSKLARLRPAAVRPVADQTELPADFDKKIWNQWVSGFVPSPDFVSRVTAYIELFERTKREAATAVAATRRLHDFSYPLSLIGMIGAVLGFGHLLSHRPPVGARSLDIDASPLALRVMTYSLLLVIVYSALDLTWTILAYQAGQMLELNPLGARLVEDPLRLIAFKVGATGLAVGLLFYLRKYCRAQLAAWWICLVLTLLTARWLTMSSMFVT